MQTNMCEGCLNQASMVGKLIKIQTYTDVLKQGNPVPKDIFVCQYCFDNVYGGKNDKHSDTESSRIQQAQ